MITVLVQILGPIDGIGCAYNWITVGKIDNPDSLDTDFLRHEVSDIFEASEYMPITDTVRLEVIIDGIKEMKITFTDFFKGIEEVK